MNEPKRRGRPTNAERDARNATVEGADVDAQLSAAVAAVPVTTPVIEAARERSFAQAYANRVWAGQSESADRPWRVSRVKEALEGQGLSMDGVELPG